MAPPGIWIPDRVELLKKLWAEGLSASQIARTMGDVTRNAVIGKVHRLGLSGIVKRPAISRRHASTPKSSKRLKNPVTQPSDGAQDKKDTLAPKRGKIFPERYQCRYPYGDPGTPTYHICQNMRRHESYCYSHENLTHRGFWHVKQEAKA